MDDVRRVREMAGVLRTLGKASRAWWLSKRPAGWTEKAHLGLPQVNCATRAEQTLGVATAALVELGIRYEGELPVHEEAKA